MKQIPQTSFYFRTRGGHYGFAHYIKRRRVFALQWLMPDGSQLTGGEYRPEAKALRALRLLKNKPARRAVVEAGW